MMAALGTIQKHFLRRQVSAVFNSCNFHSGSPLCFHVSSQLQKVKKNLTPQLVNKKKKKLEQALVKHQKRGDRVLKPIEENEVPVALKRDIRAGTRDRERTVYTSEELELHVCLAKEWTRYKMKQHLEEMRVCRRMIAAQEKALEKLKEESVELYQQAIQCDDSLLPYVFKGLVNTPVNTDYFAADGNYVDKTNYFEKDPGLLDDSDILQKRKLKKKITA